MSFGRKQERKLRINLLPFLGSADWTTAEVANHRVNVHRAPLRSAPPTEPCSRPQPLPSAAATTTATMCTDAVAALPPTRSGGKPPPPPPGRGTRAAPSARGRRRRTSSTRRPPHAAAGSPARCAQAAAVAL